MASPNFVRTALVLRGGQPRSRPGHRNKVAFFDDLHASPDDLRLAIGANVEVGQPDVVTVRVRANPDNSPHHNAFGARDHHVYLAGTWASGGLLFQVMSFGPYLGVVDR